MLIWIISALASLLAATFALALSALVRAVAGLEALVALMHFRRSVPTKVIMGRISASTSVKAIAWFEALLVEHPLHAIMVGFVNIVVSCITVPRVLVISQCQLRGDFILGFR